MCGNCNFSRNNNNNNALFIRYNVFFMTNVCYIFLFSMKSKKYSIMLLLHENKGVLFHYQLILTYASKSPHEIKMEVFWLLV